MKISWPKELGFGKEGRRPGESVMKDVFMEKWKCNRVVTKYPLSWYFLEVGRRMLSKMVV
jgi:hypothetical protein